MGFRKFARRRTFVGGVIYLPCAITSKRFDERPGPGEEWVDWASLETGTANKQCKGTRIIQSFTFAYATSALDPSAGGPGASLNIAFYENTDGFGALGIERARFTFTGLPGRLPGESLAGFAMTADLTPGMLCLIDGDIGWSYESPADVFAEMASVMPSLDNITWTRLAAESAVTYPCDALDQPGHAIVFGDGFPTSSGRAKLVPADIVPPDEQPDELYPMILTTGRQLEHWHTGAMTRRTSVLDAIEPEPVASLCSADLRRLGLVPGDAVRFTRGESLLESFELPGARYFTQVFCSACGSGMPRIDPERGIAVIPMGVLDDDPGRGADDHVFVGSMAPWYTISDDLPRFEEGAR